MMDLDELGRCRWARCPMSLVILVMEWLQGAPEPRLPRRGLISILFSSAFLLSLKRSSIFMTRGAVGASLGGD